MLARPFHCRSGLTILRGLPGSGKSLLAAMIATQYDRVAWLYSEWSDEYLWAALAWRPTWVVCVETCAQAQAAIYRLSHAVDLVVIDSLTGLRGSFSRDQSGIDIPVLLTAHERGQWTVSLGGAREIELILYRQLPALYTYVRQLGEWLVWWPRSGPILRSWVEEDDSLWINVKEVSSW